MNPPSPQPTPRTIAPDRVSAAEQAHALEPCKFCNVSTANGFDIMWENDRLVVFRDYNPSAMHHLQVIPKEHVPSVRELGRADLDLVHSMAALGNRMLDDLNVAKLNRRLGFHIPPFNSVKHLHLHVQALPYVAARRLKYPVVAGWRGHEKGLSWFVEVGQAIRILEKGGIIGVFPC